MQERVGTVMGIATGRLTSPFLVDGQRKVTKERYTLVRASLGGGFFDYTAHPVFTRSIYLAMRQTWEEIGLDLAESSWTCVGQLDDREITTSLGKRLLMVLSPFGLHLAFSHIVHAD